MKNCFCGSTKPFAECCQVYHRKLNAPTALALMKSRYSAFCVADINYIEKTQSGSAALAFNAKETKAFAQSVSWRHLHIIRHFNDKQNVHLAYVEFAAYYLETGELKAIHELSCFEFDINTQRWFYTCGNPPNKQEPPQHR